MFLVTSRSDGSYAAVIPKWINSMIKNNDVFINGDGKTSKISVL